MDRLASMAVFVKAVELGSFAAAADALALSAPMVGKHVLELERRLGVRLLNRTTRRQSLTDFGHAYLERCRSILADVAAADMLAAGEVSEPRGKLRVTMPAHFGRQCVLPILLTLAKRFPALELDLSFSDRCVDLLEDGFDLAVRTGRLESQAGTVARCIARQRMIVCAAPAYLEAYGRPDSIAELRRHRAIVYRRSSAVLPWLFVREGRDLVEFTPSDRIQLDDLAAIADAACSGEALAWLPSWLVRDRIETGALVKVLQDQPGFPHEVSAVWLRTPHLPLKIRHAVDALAAGLPAIMA